MQNAADVSVRVQLSKPKIAAITGIIFTFGAAAFYFTTRKNKCGIQFIERSNLAPIAIILTMVIISYFLVNLSESREISAARLNHGQTGVRGKINSSRFLQYLLSTIGILNVYLTAYVLISKSLSMCKSAL